MKTKMKRNEELLQYHAVRCLQGLVDDLTLFKKVEASQYPLQQEHLKTKEQKELFSICEYYYKQGFSRLTQEMVEQKNSNILLSNIRHADAVENFGLHFGYVEAYGHVERCEQVVEELKNYSEGLQKELSEGNILYQTEKYQEIVRKVKPRESLNRTYTMNMILAEEVFDEGKGFIETGLTKLDKEIGGGFETGSVNVIGGPPGSGKSTFVIQLILSALKQGKKVFFLSIEMRKSDIKNKTAAMLKRIEFDYFRKENIENEEVFNKRKKEVQETFQQYFDDEMFQIEFESYTRPQFLARLERAKEQGVDLIVCDYFQRMNCARPNGDYSEYSQLSNDVTEYIKFSDMTLVWLSQLTFGKRAKDEKENVSNAELRFCPRLHQDTFTDIRVYQKKEEGTGAKRMFFYIKKVRFGSGLDKVLDFTFNGATGVIGEFKMDEKILREVEEKKKTLSIQEKKEAEEDFYKIYHEVALKYSQDEELQEYYEDEGEI